MSDHTGTTGDEGRTDRPGGRAAPAEGDGESGGSFPFRLPPAPGLAYLQRSSPRWTRPAARGSPPMSADDVPPPDGTIGYEPVQAADVAAGPTPATDAAGSSLSDSRVRAGGTS